MNAAYQQLIFITVSAALSASAFAETTVGTKAATQIDFNRMIENNAASKQDLEKSLDQKTSSQDQAAPQDAASVKQDQKKVLDFVDVEMNMGSERPVVDRRFNSVGEARLFMEPSVKLISKKKISREGT